MSKEEAVQILTTQLNSAVQRGEEVQILNPKPKPIRVCKVTQVVSTWDLSPDSLSRSGHGGWFLPR
jgi:hypothetical protein